MAMPGYHGRKPFDLAQYRNLPIDGQEFEQDKKYHSGPEYKLYRSGPPLAGPRRDKGCQQDHRIRSQGHTRSLKMLSGQKRSPGCFVS